MKYTRPQSTYDGTSNEANAPRMGDSTDASQPWPSSLSFNEGHNMSCVMSWANNRHNVNDSGNFMSGTRIVGVQ